MFVMGADPRSLGGGDRQPEELGEGPDHHVAPLRLGDDLGPDDAAADRRARHVTATAKGRDLLSGLDDDLRAAEDHLLAPLDGEARQAFRAQLRVLAVRLNSFDPQPNPCELVARIDAGLPTPGRA